MPGFEVVPSTLSVESQRLAGHAPTAGELGGVLSAAGAGAADAAGDAGASGALANLGASAAGVLAQLEASLAGLAAATQAAGRRYENTDAGQFR
jgi:hypothetical protein